MHRRVGALEVPAEVLGERLDGRLGGVVGGVARRVGDALLATSDDNGCGLGLGSFLDDRQESADAVDDAKEVGLKDLDQSLD